MTCGLAAIQTNKQTNKQTIIAKVFLIGQFLPILATFYAFISRFEKSW
jgi:hypothetical protein